MMNKTGDNMSVTKEFNYMGHPATIICPDSPAKGNPYIWRTEFLYAFNQADTALLKKGYHIIYCEYSDEYGSDRAITFFKAFRDYVTVEYNLSPKGALFGFSRGALYAVNYALKYPRDVACLYLDAPVLDLKSWPAGFFNGTGSPDEWEDCKKRVFSWESDKEAKSYKKNPVDRLDELILSDIPVLLIAGDSDTTVPYEENGKLMADAYKKAGKNITVILKENCGHHPHSLEDTKPIEGFVRTCCEN